MFNLTKDEKQAVLFLSILLIFGCAVDFLRKSNSQVERIVTSEEIFIKLDINTVSLDDFLQSGCVTRALAEKILQFRSSRGKIKDIEELKEIKGIKDARLNKIKHIFFVRE